MPSARHDLRDPKVARGGSEWFGMTTVIMMATTVVIPWSLDTPSRRASSCHICSTAESTHESCWFCWQSRWCWMMSTHQSAANIVTPICPLNVCEVSAIGIVAHAYRKRRSDPSSYRRLQERSFRLFQPVVGASSVERRRSRALYTSYLSSRVCVCRAHRARRRYGAASLRSTILFKYT